MAWSWRRRNYFPKSISRSIRSTRPMRIDHSNTDYYYYGYYYPYCVNSICLGTKSHENQSESSANGPRFKSKSLRIQRSANQTATFPYYTEKRNCEMWLGCWSHHRKTRYDVANTAEIRLSGRWLSGSPINWIGLTPRVNLSRILQN